MSGLNGSNGTPAALQWGGRFEQPPDPVLLAFGSSLEDDLVLAPFDVLCSQAHVDALSDGKIVDETKATSLQRALAQVASEVKGGSFAAWARASGAEDVHGAIDGRVRELCDDGAGDWLHAGRSRNDQVATTLSLYARQRARAGAAASIALARHLVRLAGEEFVEGTLLAAVTHWQPAQPVLLAFWLSAAAEPFVRSARRFANVANDAARSCALGSAALAGSTLPLARHAAAQRLGFQAPSRNALDAVGTRDNLLDVAQAYVRVVLDASRVAADLIVWATPAYGYVRLGDASSTGSSLMPQKRNPDPFELVRGGASELNGMYVGALGTLAGLPLSYQRDLQQTKRLGLQIVERGARMLEAFDIALRDTTCVRAAMNARAGDGYAVATDVADALIAAGVSARSAHALVGERVREAETQGRALDAGDLTEIARKANLAHLAAPLEAGSSVRAKVTPGSTGPQAVRESIESMIGEIDTIEASL